LTRSYANEIMNETGEWISTNELIRRVMKARLPIVGVRGSRKYILQAIHSLDNADYLNSRRVKNRSEYRRNDKADSELGFLGMMNIFEMNQKIELDAIGRLDTITKTNNKLTKDGKELLDHVQDQVDRSFMVIIRMNYQSHLKVITQRTANERIMQLEDHIHKIMKALTSKYNNDSIKEYFQNHVKNLEFKI
jgi:hypothetical protein